MTTTSTTLALIAAAATITGIGLAYWSSESNSAGVTAYLFASLRARGKLHGKKKPDNEAKKKEEGTKAEEMKRAFLTWLDREENENRIKRFVKNRISRKERDLTDPRWMSETVRSFLSPSTTRIGTGRTKEATSVSSVMEESSIKSMTTSSSSGTVATETSDSSSELPPQPINQEEIKKQNEFRRSFRILQKTTEEMIQKEPIIREAFFNGINVDDELEHSDEEHSTRRRYSISSSSSGSLSSYFSSGSFGVSKDDCLVEEEGEIERLLAYLRCVELAKEAFISSSPSSSPKSYRKRTTEFIRRRRKRFIPDTDGYEQLNVASIEIRGKENESHGATVDYIAAVHRHRRELVIALHYNESSISSSSADNRDQIKDTLMNSLVLQHKGSNCVVGPATPSFLLLDQAVKSLQEEILLRFWNKNSGDKNEETHFDFSTGYTLILCGHSLGAALACRLGDTFKHPNREKALKSIPVRVYAFGPPPCLPSPQGLHQNNGGDENDYSYIVSVVNNHDCVPRWTESNLAGLQMSLRWTMDRKKRHFLQYHNQYQQARLHRKSNGNPNPIRRPAPRIPPCTLSSGDLNTFWKSSQGCNDRIFSQRDTEKAADSKYIVPGKVVLMWNHSRDPTIIGAKVHVPGRRHSHPNDTNNVYTHMYDHRKNHDVLGRLWVEENMFSDHTINSYRSNLELLLGQVGNTI